MNALLLTGLALAALYAIAIGANDMANIIGVLVGGKVTSYKIAVAVFTSSVIAGALLQGHMVIKTLGRGIVKTLDIHGAVAASLAAILWIIIASRLGLPVSTSQSAVSSVIGVGLAYILKKWEWSLVDFSVINKILISWLASPALAMLLAAIIYTSLNRLLEKKAPKEGLIKALAVTLAGWDGYSFGANDVANATGVYLAVMEVAGYSRGIGASVLLALLGAVFIALGGVIMGRRVTETVGFKITRLDPVGSISSSLVSASSTWLFTTIPYMVMGYGIPVSTTYITVGTVMGIGVAKYRSIKRGLNVKLVLTILSAWVLTLPIAALLGMCFYYALVILFGGA
ncbi:MAG: inorganic phosphate transporter [Desulfurococcaceae archaeon]